MVEIENQKAVLATMDLVIHGILRERPDLINLKASIPEQGQQARTVTFGEEVFKAPGNESQFESFVTEIHVLDHMQGKTSAPIPFITHIGRYAHFYGMQKLSGEKLTPDLVSSLSEDKQDELAKTLADFMLDMRHGFSAQDIDKLKIPTLNTWITKELLARGLENPAVKAALGDELLEKARMVEKSFSGLPPFIGTRYVSHGDLKDENLLFDRNAGSLSGILDFGITALRQPELDLSKLGNMPRTFLDKISAHYVAGGGQPINVDQALTLRYAAKICDLSIQASDPTLNDYFVSTLADLKKTLGLDASVKPFDRPQTSVIRTSQTPSPS